MVFFRYSDILDVFDAIFLSLILFLSNITTVLLRIYYREESIISSNILLKHVVNKLIKNI
jgi:hypothetical protein